MARTLNLYSRDQAYPGPLPTEAIDETGKVWTQPMEQDALDACGFAPVDDPPVYDPSSEQLVWADGAWAVDALPPPSLDALKVAAWAMVEAKRISIFNDDGYTVTSGPLAGHVLQWRLSPSEDRTNWLTSQAAYSEAVDSGYGAVAGATFRTKANVNITVTFLEGKQAILGMAAAGRQVVGRSWTLNDQIEAAGTAEEIPDEEEIASGWLA